MFQYLYFYEARAGLLPVHKLLRFGDEAAVGSVVHAWGQWQTMESEALRACNESVLLPEDEKIKMRESLHKMHQAECVLFTFALKLNLSSSMASCAMRIRIHHKLIHAGSSRQRLCR